MYVYDLFGSIEIWNVWGFFGSQSIDSGRKPEEHSAIYKGWCGKLKPGKNPVSYRKQRLGKRRVCEGEKIPVNWSDTFVRIFQAIPGTLLWIKWFCVNCIHSPLLVCFYLLYCGQVPDKYYKEGTRGTRPTGLNLRCATSNKQVLWGMCWNPNDGFSTIDKGW